MQNILKISLITIFCTVFFACQKKTIEIRINFSNLAERYVVLQLQMGNIDKEYVDAYFGPLKYKQMADSNKISLTEIRLAADSLLFELKKYNENFFNPLWKVRYRYIKKELYALLARVAIVEGNRKAFNTESNEIFNVIAPFVTDEEAEKVLKNLDALLPGEGTLQERFEEFHKGFIVPKEFVPILFRMALEELRRKTKLYIQLPSSEKFDLEFVNDKPWGAYNWYKGYFNSHIQINTDLPMYLDRVLDLTCHEAYPGHHVYHSSIEKIIVRDSGWVECSVYPLYSPQSVVSEGLANYAVELAFTKEERIEFEKKLCDVADMNSEKVERLHRVLKGVKKLEPFSNEVVRRYYDKVINKVQAVELLMKYTLRTQAQAEKFLSFVDNYGSYTVTYSEGYNLVKNYMARMGVTEENTHYRWLLYKELLSGPFLPSDLLKDKLKD
ncbi:MAG: hypothetical protein NT007_07590 [Candidatus Kapabacteria bacterium]|nr:hypothetical protein [Candidatus Kapabacteria bacterium]